MKTAVDAAILRNIALGAQPRSLQRARAAIHLATDSTSSASAPSRLTMPSQEIDAAVASGHTEGLARGREEGFRAGYSEGAGAAQQRIDDAVRAARAAAEADSAKAADVAARDHAAILSSLGEACMRFEQAAAERLAALEDDAIELAFAAVCRIVADDGNARGQVERVVANAMQSLRGARLLRVRMNAGDLERLDPAARLASTGTLPGAVEWVADASVAPGGCILDSERGSVDARLHVQLERVRKQWSQVVQSVAAGHEASP